MKGSRWQKYNRHNLFLSLLVLYGGISVASAVLFGLLGLPRNSFTMLLSVALTVIGTVIVAFYLRRRATARARVLKWEYESAEYAIRRMLNDKQIRYRKETEDDAETFSFPGQGLTLSLQPYDAVNGIPSSNWSTAPAVLLTLEGVTDKNSSFADILTNLVDEIARQPVG